MVLDNIASLDVRSQYEQRVLDRLNRILSGQYMPDNPFWYKRNNPYHNIGSATVADSVDSTFQSSYVPRQTPSQYSVNSIYPARQTMDDQTYWTGLSQDTIVKIDELRLLMNKYPKYHMNPDGIIQWAIHSSLNGDNTFLDDKLKQLHNLDSYNASQGHNTLY
ncbi:MAG: hypothetical protein WBZ36_09515 [Candidatus Nitrosopolaris sp.]